MKNHNCSNELSGLIWKKKLVKFEKISFFLHAEQSSLNLKLQTIFLTFILHFCSILRMASYIFRSYERRRWYIILCWYPHIKKKNVENHIDRIYFYHQGKFNAYTYTYTHTFVSLCVCVCIDILKVLAWQKIVKNLCYRI